jgi:hypothetical protein
MPQYSHWHYLLGYLIVTTLHNWPVMIAAAMAGLAALQLYRHPERRRVERFYGWGLLTLSYEYIKHVGGYLVEPVHFLFTTDWSWLQSAGYLIVHSGGVALLVAGATFLLKSMWR